MMTDLPQVKELLRQIVTKQLFGVIATLGDQKPYTNLVAVAFSADLKCFVFMTDRNTQKYRNILSNKNIALLIDNRSNSQSDFFRALAVTMLGVAKEQGSKTSDQLLHSYRDRHPLLAGFLEKRDTAIISVQVTEFILARFDGAERIRVDDNF